MADVEKSGADLPNHSSQRVKVQIIRKTFNCLDRPVLLADHAKTLGKARLTTVSDSHSTELDSGSSRAGSATFGTPESECVGSIAGLPASVLDRVVGFLGR